MADIRIKDLATTASSAASDDFMALDGATNGTRKMSAANPSVTTLTTSGVIAPGGSVHGANGSAANPSFAFLSDQNTGLYRIGVDNIGVAANGAKVLDIATTGLTVTGALGASSLTSPAATNLTLGTTDFGTALTVASATGNVSISSSTAGSSGAGALMVTGGLATGGASYFGGDVTVSKATPALYLVNTSASTFAQFLAQSTVNRSIIVGQFGDSSAGTTLGIANAAGALISTATTGGNYPDKLIISTQGRAAPIYFGTNNTLALTLDGTTQAATFAGTVSPQQATTAAAPAYVKGAIYFDTTLNKLRVGGATAWETITSV